MNQPHLLVGPTNNYVEPVQCRNYTLSIKPPQFNLLLLEIHQFGYDLPTFMKWNDFLSGVCKPAAPEFSPVSPASIQYWFEQLLPAYGNKDRSCLLRVWTCVLEITHSGKLSLFDHNSCQSFGFLPYTCNKTLMCIQFCEILEPFIARHRAAVAMQGGGGVVVWIPVIE